MIVKLLKRIQALEREAKANRMTEGPGIRLHRRPYGTSIEARGGGKQRAKAKDDRPRWG